MKKNGYSGFSIYIRMYEKKVLNKLSVCIELRISQVHVRTWTLLKPDFLENEAPNEEKIILHFRFIFTYRQGPLSYKRIELEMSQIHSSTTDQFTDLIFSEMKLQMEYF